jgi:hypothetical protein
VRQELSRADSNGNRNGASNQFEDFFITQLGEQSRVRIVFIGITDRLHNEYGKSCQAPLGETPSRRGKRYRDRCAKLESLLY